jgi:peptide/nickel transport system permease protein
MEYITKKASLLNKREAFVRLNVKVFERGFWVLSVWKEPFFIIGFLIIAFLFLFSFYHQIVMENHMPEEQIRYDSDGLPLEKAPFGPSERSWLGTDQFGLDLFYMLISGAKYTLGIAIIIALFRLIFGFFGGMLLSFMNRKTSRLVSGLAQSFYYLPVVLVVYFLMFPIIKNPGFTFWEKTGFQMFIMAAVAVPSITVLMKEEINLVKKEEFVSNAKIMGGNTWHIFVKHIFPQLKGKLLLLLMQQTIAVLTLLAHLGILSVFIGGTLMREFVFDLSNPEMLPTSLSFEWSGLIGGYFYQLPTAPWLVLFPVTFFGLSILAMNFMMEGLKRSMEMPVRTFAKMKEQKKREESPGISFQPL